MTLTKFIKPLIITYIILVVIFGSIGLFNYMLDYEHPDHDPNPNIRGNATHITYVPFDNKGEQLELNELKDLQIKTQENAFSTNRKLLSISQFDDTDFSDFSDYIDNISNFDNDDDNDNDDDDQLKHRCSKQSDCGKHGQCVLDPEFAYIVNFDDDNDDNLNNLPTVCRCEPGWTDHNGGTCNYKRRTQHAVCNVGIIGGFTGADWFHLSRGDGGYITAGVFKVVSLGGFGVWTVVDNIRCQLGSYGVGDTDGNGHAWHAYGGEFEYYYSR